MSSGYHLPPAEHAAFAVNSRLISCLVTEGLLRAFYLPIDSEAACGALVVLSTHVMAEHPIIDRALHPDDIFAIVALRQPPIMKASAVQKQGQAVALVDPLDMQPLVYELAESIPEDQANDPVKHAIMARLIPPPWDLGRFNSLSDVQDPVRLWNKFVESLLLDQTLRDTIEKELISSLRWQRDAFEHPPRCPSLTSPPIEWEQSLVAGHPTHPMHRARSMASVPSSYDWYRPRVRFACVPRHKMHLLGSFDQQMRELVERIAKKAGTSLPSDGEIVYVPVHEQQIPNILQKFDDVTILGPEINLEALAQSSIRTVVVPEVPGIAFKLAVGVKISSSLRTISHFTSDFGPRFSEHIVPKLAVNTDILKVETEPASAVYIGEPEVVKHFTAVLRQEYIPREGEALIVCAALLEMGHQGVSPGVSGVEHILKLDTDHKRLKFLDRYIRLACEALVPPLLYNGVAFEAHAQNVLARFDSSSGELLGFVVRDLGGLRIHPPTLRASTGIDFQFLPGHCIETESLADIYPKFYHTLFHNHLQRLIRLLGMHHNGKGWEMVRSHLQRVIPAEHPLYKTWLDPQNAFVPGKCLLRMRLQGVYRDMVFHPFPNLIQYDQFQEAPAQSIYGKETAF